MSLYFFLSKFEKMVPMKLGNQSEFAKLRKIILRVFGVYYPLTVLMMHDKKPSQLL